MRVIMAAPEKGEITMYISSQLFVSGVQRKVYAVK
jgi:hypothetical protein